jgi:hypothetical protein
VVAYALMSSLYAASALTLFWLPKSVVRANVADTHVLADLRLGLRYVASHRRLRLLVTFFVCVIMMGFSYITLLPGLVEHAFERSSQLYVPPLAFASAAGGLLVTFVTARVASSPRVIVFWSCRSCSRRACRALPPHPSIRWRSPPCSWSDSASAATRH